MLTIEDFKGATDEEFIGMLGSLTEREQMVLLLRRGLNGADPMSWEASWGSRVLKSKRSNPKRWRRWSVSTPAGGSSGS